ncbi:hypothetical protein [Chitinophaga ginsengisoli]|uniref:Uncharacterized protein n=1 Tax=Chitinophaga ginsengisoli TaxID=363837 RepID=A0A2P8G282_9BACT|nr:hypothetical protein [Chitinophaga ginsengisoli]PSL28083.1 hypothetical protein CLV42_1082 [Chitinophaga ginsengisoli]
MLVLSNLLPLFFEHHQVNEIKETVELLELKSICKNPKNNVVNTLSTFFQHLYTDHWQVAIEDGDDPFTFDNWVEDLSSFLERWEHLLNNYDEEDECKVTVTVHKAVHDINMTFVYDHDAFMHYLTQIKAIDFIGVFSRHLIKCKGMAIFVVASLSKRAGSNTVHFLENIPPIGTKPSSDVDHTKTWERLKSVCQFSGVEDSILLPSDLKLESKGALPPKLIEKFEKCALVLLLSIVADFMTIRENKLIGKLNGYKTFNLDFDIPQLSTASIDTYYKIYLWLLTGGNLQDKIGIVRNLISLNVDSNDLYTLPDAVYHSILSGFKVYERQNIKQYIELRNKMYDQLMGFNEKAGKIVETFANSFQKSALAVVSLYASMIVVRVLSAKDVKGAFTLEATMLSLAFLLISFVYFFISRWEVRQQRLRYTESYNNMKCRNEDLLTKEDITKILNNDRDYKADLALIDGKLQEYSVLWLLLLAILATITLLLFHLNQRDIYTPTL